MKAISNHLKKISSDVIILCAGNNNFLSLEDSVCAGMLVNELNAEENKILLTDSSNTAMTLFTSFGENIDKLLSETDHGQLLKINGYESDLKACAKLDSTKVIPYYSGNALKVLK
jgi:2-phosphosulfolactate phosphatase